jgi:ADP-ribose pyrophosphatase
VKDMILELPSGEIIETDSSPQDAIKRILKLQIGIDASKIEPLCDLYVSPQLGDIRNLVYVCSELYHYKTLEELNLEENFGMYLENWNLSKLKNEIEFGKLRDSVTIAAISQFLIFDVKLFIIMI